MMHSTKQNKNYENGRVHESGGALVFLVIALAPLIAMVALSVDGYALMVSKLEQENNAEFAAVAALNETLDPATNLISLNADVSRKRRAELIAGSNSYLGRREVQPVRNDEITNRTAGVMDAGYYDKSLRKFFASGSCRTGGQLVLNSVRLSLNTVDQTRDRQSSKMLPFFARALGYSSFGMKSVVVAYRDADRAMTTIAPHDSSVAARNIYDLNSDGISNAVDYQLLASFLSQPDVQAGGNSAPAGGRECYDIDNNGVVNLSDLSQMQRHLGGAPT